MARKSKAVFKMAGYTYPGTSPVTKTAGPEPKEFDVDNLEEDNTDYTTNKSKNRDVEIEKIYDVDGNVIGGTWDDDERAFDPDVD